MRPTEQAAAAGRRKARQTVSIAAALSILPGIVLARVPNEFLGRWSSDPARCRQVNGEADVLDVTRSSLSFYEIGCQLGQARRDRHAVRFAAQCYKGGSPMRAGTVVLRPRPPDGIDVALEGFSWTSEKPERFHRCHAG